MHSWKRWPLLLTLFALAGCALAGRDRIDAAARMILKAEVQEALQEGHGMSTVQWLEDATTMLGPDDSRFPEWARGSYAACLHWQESFQQEELNMDRRPGQSRYLTYVGTAQAWILMKKNLGFHILELSYDFRGRHQVWIDAWGEPAAST